MNDDPIAIIGFSLRFPQDADSAEAFWEMLYNGRRAMTEVPADRFTIDSFYAQKGKAGIANGTIPLRGGHFLKQDLAVFDAPFFNITPAEAEAMDPQHRLMLETSYHALENAGIPIAQCTGTKTSVYTASFTDDYKSILLDAPDNIPKYAATGLSMSMLANSVSWFYNFTGPSMNIDSACSSSLSALHIACQNLLSGSSEMALVGGANLVFHPDFMLIMSNMDFLSPSSRCHSFDHRANGYARGDGISVVILKRLSTALQDNDTIRAVIRATALNQDGRTQGGITQPSGDAQRTLIRETFERARLDMAPVRFFEAHGTGTVIGDPTEARAIGGSGLAGVIKTVMILERGVIVPNAGVERVNPRIDTERLCIKFPTQPTIWPDYGLRRACVNSFGFGGSNAVVILDDALNYLQDHKMQGLHRTVDIAPQACIADKTAPPSPAIPRLIVWSAADKTALSSLSSAYEDFLKTKTSILADSTTFLDMVYTLAHKRTLHSWRSYAVGISNKDLSRSIENANRVPAAAPTVPGSLAVIFTGQGAQYSKMGHGLLALPFFQNRLGQLSRLLNDIGCGWSLLELLEDANAPINEPEYSQAYTTALQIAMVDYFRDINLRPAAVIGHSSGEIAAAYCTGAITDRTALTIAFHRGRLAQRLRSMGSAAPPQGMLAVATSEQDIQSYLDRLENGTVQIGCVNSPKSTTLTGSKANLDLIEGWLVANGVFARRLRVDVAYHSRFIESIVEDYLQALRNMPRELEQDGLVPMVSTVTGNIIPARTLCDPTYWVRNMVSQVKFSSAMRLLSSLARNSPRKQLGSAPQSLSGIRMFLEIGPHSTLQGPLQDILADVDTNAAAPSPNHDHHERISYTNALDRKAHAGYSILNCAGFLWSRGYPTDLLKANGLSIDSPRAVRTDLPAYLFSHTRRHWFEDRLSSAFRFRRRAPHELLGVLSPDSNAFESRWRNILSLERVSWLEDHRISGAIVFPAAAMLAMVMEAARQLELSSSKDKTISSFEFRAVHFLNALQIPADQGVETSVVLFSTTKASRKETDSEKTWYTFRIFSYGREECMEHSRGSIGIGIGEVKANHQIEQTISQAIKCQTFKKTDIKALYSAIRTNGVSYGSVFQVLDNLRLDHKGAAVSEIRPCPDKEQIKTKLVNYEIHPLHPSTLDGLFQMVFAALSDGAGSYPAAMVPSYLSKMTIFNITSTGCALCPEKVHKSLLAYNKSALSGYRGTESTVLAMCPRSKRVVCSMEGYQTTFVSSSSSASPSDGASDQVPELQLLSNLVWRPDLALLARGQLEQLCEAARAGDGTMDDVDWQLHLLIRYYIQAALQRRHGGAGSSAVLSNGAVKMLKASLASLEEMDKDMPANIHDERDLIEESQRARLALEERLSTVGNTARFYITIGQRALHRLELEPESQGIEQNSEIMAPEEDQNLLEALLQEHLNSQHLIKPLSLVMALLMHKNPLLTIMHVGWKGDSDPGRYARMLSGSANGYCPWLRYDYVEISEQGLVPVEPGFAADFERVNEGPLDLGRDRYDFVIVSQLLYTAPNAEETLGRIRAFLKPTTRGGYLILHGVMLSSAPRTTFAGSLAPEWWLGLENNPYCTEAELDEMLVRSGFAGIDAVIPDSLDPRFCEANIIVARARAGVEGTGESLSLKNQGIVIITDGKTSVQQTFARRLESAINREPSIKAEVFVSDFAEAITTGFLQGKFCLSLLDYTRPFFTTLTPAEFELFKQALSMADGFLWVAGGVGDPLQPEFHLVDGLARALRSENSLLRFVRLTVADTGCEGDVLTVLREAMTAASLDEMEFEYEERDGVLQISRVVQSRHMNRIIGDRIANRQHKVSITLDQDTTPLQIRIPKAGEGPLLHTSDDTLLEEATSGTKSLEANEILIRVHALGLSHHDYLIASGKINSTELVSACAGVIHEAGVSSGFTVGERVLVSYTAAGRTWLKCPASSAILLPPHVSFEAAAAVLAEGLPVVYALYYMARVEEGDTVLVRCADGDTSGAAHAAVLAAKYLGANVVIASGDGDEAYSGVDAVLNYSGSSNSINASLDAVAPGGILINMSAGIVIPQHCLEIAAWKPITLATMDLAQIPRQRPARIQKLLKLFVSIYLQSQRPNGSITTNSAETDRVRVYQASELSTALDSLKVGHGSETVAVDVSPGQTVSALISPRPSPDFDPNATYVVAGGFGGLGRSICRWMVSRGARHLLILSRSGIRNESARELVEELSSFRARVHAAICDISEIEALQKVLTECNAVGLPRIRGCIQCTMVLRDAIFTNMTHGHFTTSTRPKVLNSWNLHALLPRDLDFFILLSSVGGILGAPSQANYCAGNTYMDALARYRVSLGQRAVSIDLGMMVSAGVVAETEGMLDSLQRMGWFMDVMERELFALLEVYCHPDSASADGFASASDGDSHLNSQIVVGIETPAGMARKRLEPPHWMQRPFFSHFHLLTSNSTDNNSPNSHQSTQNPPNPNISDITTLLNQTPSPSIEKATQHISNFFIAKLSQITGIPREAIDPAKPVHAADGINSLVAVELRNWVEKKVGADVAVLEILGGGTITELSGRVAHGIEGYYGLALL
ncbi:hypothetical protein BJX66DRAFT_344395 [Aspergillus keveii]|uniref:Polyketide synthase n=1 Tax=Aspergillus keveii TaxID=714993 RepID=A0ABR4FLA3_9EURO